MCSFPFPSVPEKKNSIEPDTIFYYFLKKSNSIQVSPVKKKKKKMFSQTFMCPIHFPNHSGRTTTTSEGTVRTDFRGDVWRATDFHHRKRRSTTRIDDDRRPRAGDDHDFDEHVSGLRLPTVSLLVACDRKQKQKQKKNETKTQGENGETGSGSSNSVEKEEESVSGEALVP